MAIDMLARAGSTDVYNILDGMEGSRVDDPDSVIHGRRLKSGWKASGLPWTYDLDPSRMALPERETGELHPGNAGDRETDRGGGVLPPPRTEGEERVMAEGIGAILTYAVGVAISPVPIIAVILMLFSAKARVNGPMFLAGWAVALGAVSTAAYLLADVGDAATDETASDTISWGKIVVGVLLLLLAAKHWRGRPAPGAEPEMPKWMAGIDAFSPLKAFTLALLLAGVNPKNLLLSIGAGSTLAQLGPTTADAVVSLIVYVVLASATIGGPVVYYLVGGEQARTALDGMKGWLATHNAAVMTVLFLVFGAKLIGDGLPVLG